jgi:outer membrane protein assembly factor BamB
MSIHDLVFIGFNSRVAALARNTGEIVWEWHCPKPKHHGYVTLLVDRDRLVVSVNGYMYCLDARTGDQVWYNETRGFGTGVASIATTRSHSAHDLSAKAAEQAARAAAASAGAAR